MTSSRIRPRFGGRVRPALLAPVVVAVVLGILGMHGIGAHGVNLHGPMTHAADAASPAGTATSSASDQPDAQTGGMNDMGGMVMFCTAMLAGAAVVLLALLVRRGRLPKLWAVLPPAGRVRPLVLAVLRVGTGPPAVWRFSVIRC